MRFRRESITVGLLFCVLGFAMIGRAQAVKPSAPESASQRARFTGTYRYAGGGQEDEARKAAIEQEIESMSAFTRSIARSRILATTQIPGFYAFAFDPGKIRVHPELRPEMISGDKGEPAEYVYNGKKSTLTQVLAGDRLMQVFVSDDGRRQNEFTFSRDGQMLTLKVTVSSARLSSPIVYALTYRKAD